MAEYRAYVVGEDGHFVRVVEIVCPDDETAKEYAKQQVDGHDVELWQLECRQPKQLDDIILLVPSRSAGVPPHRAAQ